MGGGTGTGKVESLEHLWNDYDYVVVFESSSKMASALMARRTSTEDHEGFLARDVRVEDLNPEQRYDWRVEFPGRTQRAYTGMDHVTPSEAGAILLTVRPDFADRALLVRDNVPYIYVAPSQTGGRD